MHVLCLADQQVSGMEKLYYYVLQTDQMLLRWLPDAEIRVLVLRHDGTYKYNAMTNTDEYVFDKKPLIVAAMTTKKRTLMMTMIV
jgi:hypothetical protein